MDSAARKRLTQGITTVAAASTVALFAAACGSSSNASSAASNVASTGTTNSTAGGDPGGAAAKAAIAPYTGQPSAFPVDTPLGKPIPSGIKIAYLQPNTPVGAEGGQALAGAAKALGANFVIVNAGTTASSAQTAASSVLAMKPAAVILGGIQLSFFGNTLKQLSAAGIKVVSDATVENTKPYGITFNYDGQVQFARVGQLMADWVIANKGPKANVAFYGIPALGFSSVVQQAFEQELQKNCASCSARAVQIDITTLGSTSAKTVVSDLQSHPSTNVAVFLADEIAAGLPAAMSSAGLSGITTIGYAPTPEELGYIKAGQMTASLGLDLPVFNWTVVDIVARLVLNDKLTSQEAAGSYPMEFLTRDSVTSADITHGWTGYPDFAQRFAKLWHAGA